MSEVQSHQALPPGTMIQEYRLERVLGIGSFGIVYRARNIYLDETVAIKEFLPSELACRVKGQQVAPLSPDTAESYAWALDRFLSEARILWELGRPEPHRSIVRVTRFHEASGTAYIVMDYEEGEPLSATLDRQGRLPLAELESILFPLLDGLERVHAASVLHRDIKPANILIRPDGSPVLIDFGAARSDPARGGRSFMAAFTPKYAPPEQITGVGDQGPWSDIYSLGATLYHAVTGAVPTHCLARIQGAQHVPALQASADQCSPTFLKAIDCAIEPAELDRPQSISEFRDLLQRIPVSQNNGNTVIKPHPRIEPDGARAPAKFAFERPAVSPAPTRITQVAPEHASAGSTPVRKKIPLYVKIGLVIAVLIAAVVDMKREAPIEPTPREPTPTEKRRDTIKEPSPAPEPTLAQVKAIIQTFECAYLVPELRPDLTLEVSGHVSNGEHTRQLGDKLRAIEDIKGIDLRDVKVYEPPFCDIVSLLRQYQKTNVPFGDEASIEFNKPDRVYKEGELLMVYVQASKAFNGYLYVDYFDSVGNAVHMFPNPLKRDNAVEAGARITLGTDNANEHPDERHYAIVPPHGRNMIVAISSSTPLFDGVLGEAETTYRYLTILDGAFHFQKESKQEKPVIAFDFITTHK